MRFPLGIAASLLFALQSSWLDTKTDWSWSETELQRGQREDFNPMCDPFTRGPFPGTLNERFIYDNGWRLGSASEKKVTGGRSIEVVYGFRSFDGMCRPEQFQAFVFVNDAPVGTLSPDLMNSRTDGSLEEVVLPDNGGIEARFARYKPNDPFCCPSAESKVTYSITARRDTFALKVVRIETRAKRTQ
jgi:hypothetical protein